MDYTVHRILQARILKWIAFPFSRSSQPRNGTQVSILQVVYLAAEPQGKPKDWRWVKFPSPSWDMVSELSLGKVLSFLYHRPYSWELGRKCPGILLHYVICLLSGLRGNVLRSSKWKLYEGSTKNPRRFCYPSPDWVSTIKQNYHLFLLLCMLSRFSCVRLFATSWTVAQQPPLSMGFSWPESWSGLPFPTPLFAHTRL